MVKTSNIIDGDDFKSTKSIERKKKKKISDDEEQDNIDTIRDNELITLTEDNIESYFGNENYVQKLGNVENEKKLISNEGIKYQIDPNNKIRLFCFKIVTHSTFELFMTLLIVANSVLTALSDYNHVDNNNNLLNDTLRNSGQLSAEPAFLACFLFEMILKMIAFGFIGPGNYFTDGWNLLDGFVVIIGLLSLLPSVPNLNVVRTFRCFRSIKLAAVSPALKNILTHIVQSIFNLGDVLIILFLVMLAFSIIGMHLFSGPYAHTRCRLTPYPVNTSWSIGLDFEPYRCLNVDNYNLLTDHPSWTKETSPWHEPQSNCLWPLDVSQKNFCSLGDSGMHQCDHSDSIPDIYKRFCGSNYDARGNPRFVNSRLLKSETYIPELSYGFANYDNLVMSFITIFQISTLNGWSGLMYMMEDSLNRASSIFFIVTFMICNYLIINLVLAIWNSTTTSRQKEKKGHGPRYKFYLRYHHYLEMKEQGEVNEEYKTNLDGSPWPDSNSTYYRIMTMNSKFCYNVICSSYYRHIVEVSILMNASVLMADYYPAPNNYIWRLEVINFILTIVFVIETSFKVAGLGLGRYMESKLRLMDCFVTFLSIFTSIENLPILFGYQIPDGLNFTTKVDAFRAFRILRILSVLHGYPILTNLIKKVLKAIRSTMAFAVIINLFIYTMALIGMTFFANRLVFDKNGYVINAINSKEFLQAKKNMPRSNFDNFLFSFASVFQIMTTEAWNSIQNDLWRSRGMGAILFTWVTLVFGVFILLSLYVGQVIDDFAKEVAVDVDHRQEMHDIDEIIAEEEYTPVTPENDEEKFYESSNDKIVKIDDIEKGLAKAAEAPEPKKASLLENLKTRLDLQSGKNPIYVVVTNFLFEKAILAVIVLSAIVLALDYPLANPDDTSSKIYNNIGNAATIFFLCEAVLKILGFGPLVYFSDGWNIFDFSITFLSMFFLYYDDPRLNSLRSFRVFRVLRPLRLLSQFPGLRLVVNALLSSLQEAGYISIILLIIWLIFGTVAVSYKKGQMRSCVGDVFTNTISTNGTYYRTLQHPVPWNQMTYDQKVMFGPDSKVYVENAILAASCSGWPAGPCCQGTTFPTDTALTSRQMCECWGGTWDFVSGVSFDNIGTALIALFSIATTEGWVTLMYNVVDSNGIDMEPIRNNSVEWIVAVLFFMMIGSFLALNIFVGVVVDAYTKSYKTLNASPLDSMMTPEQQEWVRETESRSIINDNYKEEKTSITQKGLNETAWSRIVLLSIFVNTICLAIKFFGEPTKLSVTINSIRLAISVLFIVEVFHILITKGYKMYFREFINIIDCILVIINFAGCIKTYFVTSSGDFYFVSIFRLLVAINMTINMYPVYFQSMKTFIRTILKTIPAFCNIGTLVLLFLFIWSLIGVNTYSKVEFYGTHNQYANFRNLNTAFITIIRFMTGEGWSQFMYDLSRVQPGCVPDPPYNTTMCGFNDFYGCIPMNGCGHVSAFPFFFGFQIFVAYITLNLTVAVILENYLSLAYTRKATINPIVRVFVAGWLNYDTNKKCYLNYSELEQFAIDSDCNPYSFPPDLPLSKVRNRLVNMQIRCFLGKGCYLSDVLAGFQKDYAEHHKDEIENDPNLNVISIAASEHFNLDSGPGQTNNFLRSYYLNKNLSKELNISLARLKLKKNKRMSIIKGLQISKEFETKFYIARSFLLWKHGPGYSNDIIWPKIAKKYEESVTFVLPYSQAILSGVGVIGGGVGGMLGSWFSLSNDNYQETNSHSNNNNDDKLLESTVPESSISESEPVSAIIEEPVKKKVKKKKVNAGVSETVPEDSGDEGTGTKKVVKPLTKKKIKKKSDPSNEEKSP